MHTYFKSRINGDSPHLKWITWGLAIPFFLFVINLTTLVSSNFLQLSYDLDQGLVVLNLLSLIFIPLSFTFAIFKYRLMDIDLVIKRSVVYTIVGLILMIFFDGLSSATTALVSNTPMQQSSVPQLIVAFTIAWLFRPLVTRVENYVERRFYPERYTYRNTLLEISRQLRQTLGLPQIARLLIERIMTDMRVQSASLFLYNRKTAQYHVIDYRHLPADLVESIVFTTEDELIRQPTAKQGALSVQLNELADPRLQSINGQVCVPFFIRSRLIGLLILGPKESRDLYMTEDIQLFDTIAGQAAIALENAILNEEVTKNAELRHELNIAAQIQRELLPQHIPVIPGFDLDGFSQPARQVGGDLYDFIVVETIGWGAVHRAQNELNTGNVLGEASIAPTIQKLGIVIGDVSGKSVSAAMVMAVAQGVVQMTARYSSSPAQILSSVNNLLCARIGRNRFVALCYAEIDPETLHLNYSLAGLPQPVLVRRGHPQLLDMCDHRLPLGQFRDLQFDQQNVQLECGDTLVFYSDGLDEAVNPRIEMYGTERLLKTLTGINGESARTIRQRILDDIAVFSEEAEQFDDLTLVVVRIKEIAHG